jgi:hypothetical protein
MKRALILLAFLSVLAVACGRKTSDADCDKNWRISAPDSYLYGDAAPGYALMVIDEIMNRNYPPKTAGAYLQECLGEEWQPPELR